MSVCRCSQTAGHNYCSIVSGDVSNWFISTDSTSSHELASQFSLQFFIREKHPKHTRLFMKHRPAIHGKRNRRKRASTWVVMAVGGLARARASVCVCACVRVCVRAYMRACVVCLPYTIILFDQAANDNN